ncbi:DUF3140 domain-containing protein [Marisediminicola senii]|uniref:DUF3140 domain-containing protein n=1 Tax=Marisediminicola senii TaxID=2711233 RepID=UPI0013E9EEB5|nr:DUF3140 domain-containing protein [Marisediminicola senii]
MSDDDAKTREDFRDAVNMTPAELKTWLETDDSRAVGQKDGGSESVGHESGRHIIRILEKNKSNLTSDDYAHMRKVVGYVHRHRAQRPEHDVEHSRWRYSLMNWGHDPQK